MHSATRGYQLPLGLTPVSQRAHARHTDPETSHEAAASVTDLTARQTAVLRCFDHPLTDTELAVEYEHRRRTVSPQTYPRQSESGLRTRRSELVARKLLRFSGEYRKTDAGRRARVWEVVS